MIANRQSPKNFIEPISKELKLLFEPPFIHFFRPTGTIKGLSFSEVPECQKVFDLLCSLRGPLMDPVVQSSLVTDAIIEKPASKPSSVQGAGISKGSASKSEKTAAINLKRAENGRNNLEAVQKIDLFADKILGGCSHVSLYDFDSCAKKWVKTDMNGPMFIYKRIDYPFHSFVIINRQSSTSHVEPLLQGITVKFEPPYLFIYRPDGIVKGLWFFNTNECRKVYDCLHPLWVN
uniref:Uncharacterized protein n=1 Tax=Ditylenchus dipsaci TaxID=166011 RepID=A0A915EQT4_9BILA